jgi:RNA polymerase sigma factor (TIGR02999 family)
MSHVTQLLEKAGAGKNPKAEEELLNAVYSELRNIAQAKMRNERPGHTLQATILVHDAWLKLSSGDKPLRFESRKHFNATAASLMRKILIDHARKRLADKRGGDPHKTEFSDTEFAEIRHEASDELLEAVDEALKEIYEKDKISAQIVEWRFFLGLTMDEVADAMQVSKSTVEREYDRFKKKFKSKFKGLI